MEKNQLTEKILTLTLEIIYLLTGEDYGPLEKESKNVTELSDDPLVSSGYGRSQSFKIQPSSLTPENKDKKILDVTNEMIELLTGEVPIRCQDVSVYFSMEEWEYVEGHKDLYKDIVIMEDQPPLTSPGKFSKRNSAVRCPHPLDSTKEHPEIPLQCEREHLIGIKYEPADDEELYTRNDEPCKKEDVLPEIITDGQYRGGTLEEHHILTPLCQIEDECVNMSSNFHSGLLDLRLSSATHSAPGTQPPDALSFFTVGESITHSEEHIPVKIMDNGTRLFSCSECGKRFKRKSSVIKHRHIHTSERPYPCSECGKWFIYASQLTRHQKTHTGERPYSCSHCGKCFSEKSNADRHWQSHTDEKPHQCPECGKCFKNKYHLLAHLRFHTDEKPYACSVCGKSFKQKSDMVKHQRRHSGEKPYTCSVCGKSFSGQTSLIRHEITHTGQKPYSCSDCGKQFTQKSHLITHERLHSGSKPFSCSTCGKCFTDKGVLVRHEKGHYSEEKH